VVRKIEIYADGADLETMRYLADSVDGFTTNPSLCRKAGITDYRTFGKKALLAAGTKPVSLEVFADDEEGMIREGREIASWGANVFVKVPITNTFGEWSGPVIRKLLADGIKVNITAVMTMKQVLALQEDLSWDTQVIISIFAGRVADTGRDPVGTMKAASHVLRHLSGARLLWASPREIYNVVQAEQAGCHIITLPPELIKKLDGFGKDLNEYSLETVKQFHEDARGMTI
jgi:transaldolase